MDAAAPSGREKVSDIPPGDRTERRTGGPPSRKRGPFDRKRCETERGQSSPSLQPSLDGIDVSPKQLQVPRAEVDKAYQDISAEFLETLRRAERRIRKFHALLRSRLDSSPGTQIQREKGIRLAPVTRPLERVGIYVPGGKASYPSTALMAAIPARVAGVREILMVTPPQRGGISPAVLVAADLAGVDRIYRVGGAQAIAALAFGTESISKVDKIVGPGNRYVAAAKRLVYGAVDIDMVAGPSEIVVIADAHTPPSWVAADLLSRAEHDEMALGHPDHAFRAVWEKGA